MPAFVGSLWIGPRFSVIIFFYGGLPLLRAAAGVLAPIGILLSPAVGALLMPLSTVIVAINALLLRQATL
jgi:Cu2+-exporting ATPase